MFLLPHSQAARGRADLCHNPLLIRSEKYSLTRRRAEYLKTGQPIRLWFILCIFLYLSCLPAIAFSDPVINVISFGAVCNGATNDTTAIRAAAAAVPDGGGTLLFPDGLCLVSDASPLKSGTHVLGTGGAIRSLPQNQWPHGIEGAFSLNNVKNVTIEGLQFAWQHGFYNGGAAHIIEAVNSQNIVIRNNISDGGGDFMAAIGSTDVLMERNRVTEVDNACYDAWGGSHRVRVIDNTCTTTAREHPGVGAVQFTGIATNGAPSLSTGFYASGNTITINTPNGQAFEINGSPRGGTDDGITIINNKLVIGAEAWGVLATYASHGNITHNFIEATTSRILGALFVADTSSDWNVNGNDAHHIPNSPNAIFTNNSARGELINNRAFTSPAAKLLGHSGQNMVVSGNSFLP